MRLARRRERVLDADVQLLRAGLEPGASARPQGWRLGYLGQAEQLAVEPARLVLAAGRRGQLNVIDPDDAHARRYRAASVRTAWAWRLTAATLSGPDGSSTTKELPARTRALTQRDRLPG